MIRATPGRHRSVPAGIGSSNVFFSLFWDGRFSGNVVMLPIGIERVAASKVWVLRLRRLPDSFHQIAGRNAE